MPIISQLSLFLERNQKECKKWQCSAQLYEVVKAFACSSKWASRVGLLASTSKKFDSNGNECAPHGCFWVDMKHKSGSFIGASHIAKLEAGSPTHVLTVVFAFGCLGEKINKKTSTSQAAKTNDLWAESRLDVLWHYRFAQSTRSAFILKHKLQYSARSIQLLH